MRRKSGVRRRCSSGQASTALQAPDSKACSSVQSASWPLESASPVRINSTLPTSMPAAAKAGAWGMKGGLIQAIQRACSRLKRANPGATRPSSPMPALSQRISLKAARGQPWPGSSRSSQSNPVGSPVDCASRAWPGRSRARQSSAEDRSCCRLEVKILVLHTVFQQNNCIYSQHQGLFEGGTPSLREIPSGRDALAPGDPLGARASRSGRSPRGEGILPSMGCSSASFSRASRAG